MKLAPCTGKNWVRDKQYECKQEWPEDCFVQAGEKGLVLARHSYSTAFFEAFPKNPSTFIRGEGKTVAKAEKSAWVQFQKYLQCPGHEFERRSYKNGAGFYRHCELFNSNAFQPLTKCSRCGRPTYFSEDADGNWWCKVCIQFQPKDKRTAMQRFFRALERRANERQQWQESETTG
jgi:hypothetical protein